jgi:hypothetical protein
MRNQQKNECQPKAVETESDLLSRYLFEEGDVYLSGTDYSTSDFAGQKGSWASQAARKEVTA